MASSYEQDNGEGPYKDANKVLLEETGWIYSFECRDLGPQ